MVGPPSVSVVKEEVEVEMDWRIESGSEYSESQRREKMSIVVSPHLHWVTDNI